MPAALECSFEGEGILLVDRWPIAEYSCNVALQTVSKIDGEPETKARAK